MKPAVIWSIQANKRLASNCSNCGVPDSQVRAELEELLARSFGEARFVLVVDRLRGYSDRADKHILRVEVTTADRQRSCIIQFLRPDKERKMLAAWASYEEVSHANKLPVLELVEQGASSEQWVTFVYKDAHEVAEPLHLHDLEDVVIDAAMSDSPTVFSVRSTLKEALSILPSPAPKASGSFAATRAPTPADCRQLQERLSEGVQGWGEGDRRWCRQLAHSWLRAPVHEWIDPVDFALASLARPEALPSLRIGWSHGDLHGRNILVWVDASLAGSSLVYDFEDMGRDKMLGWDFAKLELELKVRLLPLLLPEDQYSDFLHPVLAFEQRLAGDTAVCESSNSRWEARDLGTGERDRRARDLLLEVRELARKYLSVDREQHELGNWLDEHHFMLACYSVYSGRFTNSDLNPWHKLAAIVAGGVAAARYLWRGQENGHLELARELARSIHTLDQIQTRIRAEAWSPRCVLDPPPIGHQGELAVAQTWVGLGTVEDLERGLALLERLEQEYPLVTEVIEQQALALFELRRLDPRYQERAEQKQKQLKEQDVESLCRRGRWYKDQGHEAQTRAERTRNYRLALDQYKRASALSEDYFPGINVAFFQFMLGEVEQARTLAVQLLGQLDRLPGSELTHWAHATMGEACLLLKRFDAAADYYRAAVRNALPRDRETMWRQIQHILGQYAAGDPPWQLFTDIFGPPTI